MFFSVPGSRQWSYVTFSCWSPLSTPICGSSVVFSVFQYRIHFWKVLVNSFLRGPLSGFAWCFLSIKLRSCISGNSTAKVTCLAQCIILRLHDADMLPYNDHNHLVKLVSRFLHCEVVFSFVTDTHTGGYISTQYNHWYACIYIIFIFFVSFFLALSCFFFFFPLDYVNAFLFLIIYLLAYFGGQCDNTSIQCCQCSGFWLF